MSRSGYAMRGLDELERKWRLEASINSDPTRIQLLSRCADDLAKLRESWGVEAVAWTDQRGIERLRDGKQELVGPAFTGSDNIPLFTHPADEMVVTDEMVEVACENIWPDFWESHVNTDDLKVARREYMRAALTAALEPQLATAQEPAAGDAYPTSSDREVLAYLMQQFDCEIHVCPHCNYSDPTADCDSAIYLREYLAKPKPPLAAYGWPDLPEPWLKGEFGRSDLYTADQLRAYGRACRESGENGERLDWLIANNAGVESVADGLCRVAYRIDEKYGPLADTDRSAIDAARLSRGDSNE